MIEPKFTSFQVQQKGMLGHTGKLVEATFGKAPARLAAVNMSGTLHELVVAVMGFDRRDSDGQSPRTHLPGSPTYEAVAAPAGRRPERAAHPSALGSPAQLGEPACP